MSSKLLEYALINEERREGRRPAIVSPERPTCRRLGAGNRQRGDECLGRDDRGEGSRNGEGGSDAVLEKSETGAISVCTRLTRDVWGRSGPHGTSEATRNVRRVPSCNGEGSDERAMIRVCPPWRQIDGVGCGSENASAEEEVVDGVEWSIVMVMCGLRWLAEVNKGGTKMRAGSPGVKGVMRALGVSGGPCRVEVAPENGASETSAVMLRLEVMDLVEDILRRRKMAMPRRLKEVSEFRVERAGRS